MEACVSTNEFEFEIENENEAKTKEFSVNELNYIRETIEKMNKFNQIEILRILNKYESVTLNENKFGVHINLTDLSNEIIQELSSFITYVARQEQTLNSIERQKEDYRNTYFTKDIKDKH